MAQDLQQQLASIQAAGFSQLLTDLNHGIEKEGLRVTPEGQLSQADHPRGLGSALANGSITTDYSEALLEFITPVFKEPAAALDHLANLHRFSYAQMGSETIWNASMPCHLNSADDIQIGRYGSSNIGQMKHIYRVGLEHRYGKIMQSIAGIHYNFSVSDELWQALLQLSASSEDLQSFRSRGYFSQIRNFRRSSWLLLYLFGASPALCRSFMAGAEHQLEELDEHTLYLPYATSLRMSDLGYSNKAQASLGICFNQLDSYIDSLSRAIATPYADYQALGVKVDGSYRQLNANVLQIENEYYSDIRPKRVTESGEKPVHALANRGVQYIEVRNTDINPLLPVGIDLTQARFMDAFLVTCLLEADRDISQAECELLERNNQRVVQRGREPGLKLETLEGEQSLTSLADAILDKVALVAKAMDSSEGEFSAAVAAQRAKVADSSLTPSAQLLELMQQRGLSYNALILELSQQQQQQLLAQPLAVEVQAELTREAEQSLKAQAEVEAADSEDFDTFLANYMAN